ncbi:MAG: tetratricopeptide repeat protein [Bryobacteraceae bacterium]
MSKRVTLAAVCILFRLPCYPQFLPDLQAKSPAEYDAYLDALDGPTLEKGASFELAFPHSALRLPVCELMAKAFRSEGRADEAVAAASRGLAIAPDYIPLLVELADLLANGPRDLDRAATSAQRALELLQTAKAPLRVSPNDWLTATAGLRARAHSALGMVRFKRDDPAGAILQFEAALGQRSPGDPAIHYRLGRLYVLFGRTAEAKVQLQEAARAGDKVLRDLANAALAAL